MSDQWVVLKKYEFGDENREAYHPLMYKDDTGEHMTFDDIQSFLYHIEMEFLEYNKFRFNYTWKSHGYGAETNWWELQGSKDES